MTTESTKRSLWRRIVDIAKPFWFSREPWTVRIPVVGTQFTLQEKWKARGLLALLALFLFSVNMLNVSINFVAGRYQDALQAMDADTYWYYLFVYAGVFVVGTPIVVFYSFIRDKLSVVWRKWLTEHLLTKYFANRAYYKVNNDAHIDNPDERIANDISGFVGGTLSLALAIVDSILTFCSFITILWMISPKLVGVVSAYALIGSVITILLSFRLIKLNYNQQRLEADYRYNLIHVRNNVESIAFYQGEAHESMGVRRRFAEAIKNYNFLIGWQRNVSMFTTGYNYMVIIVPALVIAPMYFAGTVKLGAFTQASLAFSQVLAALSIVVSEVRGISSLVAYVNRLGGFLDAIDRPSICDMPGNSRIESRIGDDVALEKLTLQTPNYERTLVTDLDMTVAKGTGALIKGPSGSGKSSILRGIAGLWRSGQGTIVHPAIEDMMFLPQRPYMVLGSLREQMLYPSMRTDITDAEIVALLKQVNLGNLPERFAGGFDAIMPWADTLSLGEQQRVAFIRLLLSRPKYAILDEATSALDVGNEEKLYKMLQESGTTFVSVGHRPTLDKYHKQTLTLDGIGGWELSSN